MFNGSRLIGPAVGGVLIGLLGEGICFLLNGISYIAVIIALLASSQCKTENTDINRLKSKLCAIFGF